MEKHLLKEKADVIVDVNEAKVDVSFQTKLKRLKQRGVTLTEIAFVLILIGLVGVGGYYIGGRGTDTQRSSVLVTHAKRVQQAVQTQAALLGGCQTETIAGLLDEDAYVLPANCGPTAGWDGPYMSGLATVLITTGVTGVGLDEIASGVKAQITLVTVRSGTNNENRYYYHVTGLSEAVALKAYDKCNGITTPTTEGDIGSSATIKTRADMEDTNNPCTITRTSADVWGFAYHLYG